MVQDHDLREIEALILEMEALEKKCLQTKEQKKWVDDSLQQKQAEFEEMKKQHELKIKEITRQVRKNREKSQRGKVGKGASLVGQPDAEEASFLNPAGGGGGGSLAPRLDLLFDEEEREKILGESGSWETANLDEVSTALQAKLDELKLFFPSVEELLMAKMALEARQLGNSPTEPNATAGSFQQPSLGSNACISCGRDALIKRFEKLAQQTKHLRGPDS